jgi:hypothetical protein
MDDDDDLGIYATVASRLGITVDEVIESQEKGSWSDDIAKRINLEKMKAKHGLSWPHPSQPGVWPNVPPATPPKATIPRRPVTPPSTPAPAPAPKTPPPPILMRATMRVHFSKFTPDFLPRETIYAMMRNQVVPGLPSTIPAKMIEWCEKNCADLWVTGPGQPDYIMFASEVDMTLFLTAFGGG